MANKDLLKQAIAEAKSVREAAIANAKEALEETLTPHLKDMLAAKLQEMEDSSVEEEVVNEVEEEVEEAVETVNEEVNEEETVEESTEEVTEEETVAESDGLEAVTAEAEHDEAEDDSEESEDEAEEIEDAGEEDEAEGDEELGDLTVDQFKDLIRDIIAHEMGHGEEPADDLDAGDIEGMGDEEALEEPAELPAGDEEEIDVDEEIDLDELLAELEATEEVEEGKKEDDKSMEEEVNEESTDEEVTEEVAEEEVKEEVAEESSELNEALETIETLKKELNEVNILNSKLLYVNKIFKANNLTESQKVNIIAAFDKAETVKEVKLVFETVSENIVNVKKENVSESKVKGMASKATGTTASKPENQIVLSEAALRMQKLAGIIK